MCKYLSEMSYSASVGRGALAPPLTLRNGIYTVISSIVERSRGSEYDLSGTVLLFSLEGDFSASFGFHTHFGRNDVKKR